MAFEHRDMTGSLFENDRKTEERHPDWKGKVMFSGKLYDIAGWDKDVNGKRLISLKISEPRPQQGQGQYRQPAQQPARQPAPATRPAARPAPQPEYQGESAPPIDDQSIPF
jgi:hypothetical protein